MHIKIDKLNEIPIVQQCLSWERVEDHEMLEKLSKKGFKELNNIDVPYNYFIYIDNPTPIVLLHLMGSESLLERITKFPNFKDVLILLPELNYDSILFVLSNYMIVGEVDPVGLIQKSKRFTCIPKYDDLLSPTYGYLFYKYQLEQLIARMSDNSHFLSICFRIDWNKKKKSVMDEFSRMELLEGVNLIDFVKERTLEENNFLWNPNFRGAQNLWDYLIDKNQ